MFLLSQQLLTLRILQMEIRRRVIHSACCGFLVFRQYTHVTLVTPLSSDPAGTLCHRALNPPRGSVHKPLCEINPFLPQPSTLKWVAPLTDSQTSPIYLQADWFSTSHQGVNKQLTVASIMRAPTATKEHSGND